jgi:hypothetical protein
MKNCQISSSNKNEKIIKIGSNNTEPKDIEAHDSMEGNLHYTSSIVRYISAEISDLKKVFKIPDEEMPPYDLFKSYHKKKQNKEIIEHQNT